MMPDALARPQQNGVKVRIVSYVMLHRSNIGVTTHLYTQLNQIDIIARKKTGRRIMQRRKSLDDHNKHAVFLLKSKPPEQETGAKSIA